MPVEELPIFSYFNPQRFTQFGCMDAANWYGVSVDGTKKTQALYPAMGRRHITFFGQNKLVFTSEPRFIFRSINFIYIILDTTVIQIDPFYNEIVIGNVALGSTCWFDFLPVGTTTYCMLTDGTNIFIITENNLPVTMQAVTDPNRPINPYFVAAFGNRFVVSTRDTPDFALSTINLINETTGNFDISACFTIDGAPLFNRASGIIGQLGVLHSQLYIFCSFSTDVWANIPSQNPLNTNTRPFPWKQNTSYNFDFGIYDALSLSIDFGMMVWLANNRNGLVSFMMSNGQQPQTISSQAVNVLLQNSANRNNTALLDPNAPTLPSPFLSGNMNGFLYQWENTIFYRASAGNYLDFGELDINESANAIEYNFSTQTWGRVTEVNGERNRIQKHVYFNNVHLVTVSGDDSIYQMAGNIYSNEIRTPGTAPQDINAFTRYPLRYLLVTQQIFAPDYSEFITDYVEIDFVFGDSFYKSDAPFGNTIFIITEDSEPISGEPIFQITEDAQNGESVFIIMEEGNTPGLNDIHYNTLFKPHIELYYSDDGGVTFTSADLREFSQIGQYRWRMRWFELGASRNRCYKLICVSPAPIVVLGAVQDIRRASGGAN